MSTEAIILTIFICVILFSALIVCTSDDEMTVPWVSCNTGFGGGRTNIPKTKLRNYRFAKAADDGPDGRWLAGDLLIYDKPSNKPVHFSENRYYIFVRYSKNHDGIPVPRMHVLKCIKWEHTKRPVFETNLENDYKCVGELRGIQINGKNIMY